MKNVKLTLATTLSVLALTFAGAASADGGGKHDKRFNKQKEVVTKTTLKKSMKQNAYKSQYQNKKVAKRVIVKNSPQRKVIISRTIVKKPAKSKYAKNKRFQHVKQFKEQYRQYQNRNAYYAKRTARQTIYSVRPGDTLIQISYKTGVSIPKLARLNRISHRNLNHLRVGQKLRLV